MPKARQVVNELPAVLRNLERRLAAVEAKIILPAVATEVHRTSLHLVEVQELASASQEFEITGIPGDSENLRIIVAGFTAAATGAIRTVYLRLNGDSGTNYHWKVIEDVTVGQTLSDTAIKIGNIDGASAGRSFYSTIDVLNYASTADDRGVQAYSHGIQPSVVRIWNAAATWLNTTDPVTSFKVFTNSSDTLFAAGSKCWLYAS